jgi:hypothetical protein
MNTTASTKQIFVYFFTVVFILSCFSQKKVNNSGIVLFKSLFYKPLEKKYLYNEFVIPAIKVWFKDSTVILRMMGVSKDFNNGKLVKAKLIIDNYTYIDLTKMVFYKYNSFTDTASIVQSYNKAQSDTLYWGTRFYKDVNLSYILSFENLTDTIIAGRNIKRIKMMEDFEKDSANITTSIAYFDCGMQGTIFQINKSLSKYAGCPMVGYYILPSEKNPNARATEIEFIVNTLTTEELKIFDAWEKNAKKYPVK